MVCPEKGIFQLSFNIPRSALSIALEVSHAAPHAAHAAAHPFHTAVAAAREGFLPYPQRAIHTSAFVYIRNFRPERTPMGDGPRRQQRRTTMTGWEERGAELGAAAGCRRAQLAFAVGSRVRELRTARGMTPAELAARVRSSQAAIARLEAGGTEPRLSTLDAIARALGATLRVEVV